MPEGWRPPDASAGRERAAELLADSDTWARVALAAGRPIGHVAFVPAPERVEGEPPAWVDRPPIPGLAHLWQLFVLPEWWGRGVAPALHDAALDEMRARGYVGARLFTPSGSLRARRFYERRGSGAEGEDWFDPLAMACTETGLTSCDTNAIGSVPVISAAERFRWLTASSHPTKRSRASFPVRPR